MLPASCLGPDYGGGNEDDGDLLQKVSRTCCCIWCPQACIRPPLTQASAGNSWTLAGKSGSVSCGVTAPFSWVLVHTRFCLCPPRVCFPVLCKFWQLYVGLMATSSKQVPYPCLLHPEPLPLRQASASAGDTQTQFWLSLLGWACILHPF